jgi:hypothetical protein
MHAEVVPSSEAVAHLGSNEQADKCDGARANIATPRACIALLRTVSYTRLCSGEDFRAAH